jgi:hypothetical protein
MTGVDSDTSQDIAEAISLKGGRYTSFSFATEFFSLPYRLILTMRSISFLGGFLKIMLYK